MYVVVLELNRYRIGRKIDSAGLTLVTTGKFFFSICHLENILISHHSLTLQKNMCKVKKCDMIRLLEIFMNTCFKDFVYLLLN